MFGVYIYDIRHERHADEYETAGENTGSDINIDPEDFVLGSPAVPEHADYCEESAWEHHWEMKFRFVFVLFGGCLVVEVPEYEFHQATTDLGADDTADAHRYVVQAAGGN